MSKKLSPLELQSYLKGLHSFSSAPARGNTPPGPCQNEEKPTFQLWRERGNRHFQAERYEDALSCYNTSIDAKATSAAYANRAMVYLKMNQYAECISDCTKCLEIEPSYVKAYLRRGTAKKCLDMADEAIMDFEMVLRYEPNNHVAKENRQECLSLWKARNGIQELPKYEIPVILEGVQHASNIKRQAQTNTLDGCVAHKISKEAGEDSRQGETSAISSKEETKTPFVRKPSSQQNASSDGQDHVNDMMVKSKDETAITNSRDAQKQQNKTSVELEVPVIPISRKLKPPKNGIEFEKQWRSFKGDEALQSEYLILVDPSKLPFLLKQALAPHLLFSIANTLLKYVIKNDPSLAASHLEFLSRVDRFDMNLMSLSKSQKASLAHSWQDACNAVDLKGFDAIRTLYRL